MRPRGHPSGSVWRDGVDRAGERRTQGVPITCATRLSVQEEDSAGAAQAPGGPLLGLTDGDAVAADVALLATGDHHDRVLTAGVAHPPGCAGIDTDHATGFT